MKPVRIVVVPLLVLAFIVGSIVLAVLSNQSQSSYWDLLPDDALLVYYTEQTETFSIKKRPPFSLEEISGGDEELYAILGVLDSVLMDATSETLWRTNLRCYTSVHPTNKTKTGTLYMLYPGNNGKELFKWLREGQASLNRHFSNRMFNQIELKERTMKDSTKLTFMVYQDWIVASFEPLLVEDVVRKVTMQTKQAGFDQLHPVLFKVGASQTSGNRIYLMLSAIMKRFISPESSPIPLASGAYLDGSAQPGVLTYTGYLEAPQVSQWIKHLQVNRPRKPTLWHMVPTPSLAVEFFGFDNGTSLLRQLLRADSCGAYSILEGWNELRTLYQYDPVQLFEEMRGELYRIHVNYGGAESKAQMLLIKMDSLGAVRTLEKLKNRLVVVHNQDSTYIEQFGGAEITELECGSLPQKLFGSAFSGFEEAYGTLIGDVWVLSDDLQAMKWYITTLKNGEVWSRDPILKEWSETSVSTTNYLLTGDLQAVCTSLGLNNQAASNYWIFNHWSSLAKAHRFSVQLSFEQGLVPLLSMEIRYDTSELPTQPSAFESLDTGSTQQIQFEYSLEKGPYVLQTQGKKATELLVQDSLGFVHAVRSDGQKLWSINAGEPVIGVPFRLQKGPLGGNTAICFASKCAVVNDTGTATWIYLATDLDLRPEYWNVFDYDQTGDYRFIFVDTRGKVLLLDAEFKPLLGWNPLLLKDGLIAPPEHVRIKNRDVLVAVLRNGSVRALNRKGSDIDGFPMDIKQTITAPFAIRIGSSLEKSTINVLSQPGEYFRITFTGDVLFKKTLLKPDKYTKVQLVKGSIPGTWSIAHYSNGTLQLFDDKAEKQLKIEGLPLEDPVFESSLGRKNQPLFMASNASRKIYYLLQPGGNPQVLLHCEQCVGYIKFRQEGQEKTAYIKEKTLYIENNTRR